MKTNIGIPEKKRSDVANFLCLLLADEFVLYTKTKKAHWNIEGIDFYSKHLFFESQFDQLDEIVDSVAERIRVLGHYAPATLSEYLSLTQLTEKLMESNTSEGFIKELLADHESIIIRMRESINRLATELSDAGTSDFITSLMETHEKMAWMLRSHLNH